MNLLQALILGIVQGATEFLPISSSGHLVLVPWLLGWQGVGEGNLAFDTLLHWGTLLAVVAYFWKDIARIAAALWETICYRRGDPSPEARLGWFILLGSVPAALVGFFLEEWFEQMFKSPLVVAIALLGTAGLLFSADMMGKRDRTLDTLNWRDAILVGCAQALAIIPGISRSGATIAAGLFRNVMISAPRFSWISMAFSGVNRCRLPSRWLRKVTPSGSIFLLSPKLNT